MRFYEYLLRTKQLEGKKRQLRIANIFINDQFVNQ